MRRQWCLFLQRNQAWGIRTREAVLPVLDTWLDCGSCTLDYYSTQVMTGHGVFGTYLSKIGKMNNAICMFCDEMDSPDHTVFKCGEWEVHRRSLAEVLDLDSNAFADLTFVELIAACVASRERWRGFRTFCLNVMSLKGEEEKARQRAF